MEISIIRKIYEHRYDKGERHHFFLCNYVSGEPKLDKEADEVKESAEGNVYEPMWLPITKLPKTLLYPLEIRDWLIDDIKRGFPEKLRVAKLKISELRQIL